MEKDVTAGPLVSAHVELPDLPEGATAQLSVEITAETEEAARATIEAFGGVAAWGDFSYGLAWLKQNADGLTVTLHVPKRLPRPPEQDPFVLELNAEREAAMQAEADVA